GLLHNQLSSSSVHGKSARSSLPQPHSRDEPARTNVNERRKPIRSISKIRYSIYAARGLLSWESSTARRFKASLMAVSRRSWEAIIWCWRESCVHHVICNLSVLDSGPPQDQQRRPREGGLSNHVQPSY